MTTEMVNDTADAGSHLDHVVIEVMQILERRWGVPADVGRVRELVEREWARYDDAPVRTFLPVLVRRSVIDDVLRRPITEPGRAGVRITAG